MKERIFFDNEFEKQLKEKSDQFKMYPSDRVWSEVHRTLHSRRKGFVAGMSVLVGGILVLAGAQLINPSRNIHHVPAVNSKAPKLESVKDIDLSAFNPAAFSTVPNTARLSADHPQVSKTPFISFPGIITGEGFPYAEKESRSPVGTKPEIAAIPDNDRPANIALPQAPENAGSGLKENAAGTQKLPAFADVSDLAPAAEKAVARSGYIRNDRFSWEIYLSPTLNTRHLYGVNYQNIDPTIQRAPITVVRFANVNGFVDNTPAMGYDLGGNLLYRVSNNFSLKAGLQFSFSRYYINAYNSSQPQASAVLNSYLGYIADSLSNPGRSGTVNSKNPQHFQNKFYQLSLPIGIEMKVAGKGRLQVHVGASFQPAYLLNSDAYILSSDYSNYSKEPAVLRKWNFNAGAEVFISYRVGKVRWELGPMIRYQLLSTYKDAYPLKENLMNYGIRLGFSKTIR